MKNLIIVGSSGHATSVIDCVEQTDEYRIIGLIDSFRRPGESTLNYPILGNLESIGEFTTTLHCEHFFLAVGDNHSRKQLSTKLSTDFPTLQPATIVHPSSTISRHSSIGKGSFIASGVIVGPGVTIKDFCILNTKSSIDHDSQMGMYASLAPGAVVGGRTKIGDCTAICIGCTVSHKICIGDNVVLGASSLAIKDIPSNVVAYGCPAREIRPRKAHESYL